MSLINEMLKNLDSRRDSNDESTMLDRESINVDRYSFYDLKPYLLSALFFVVIFILLMFFKSNIFTYQVDANDRALVSSSKGEAVRSYVYESGSTATITAIENTDNLFENVMEDSEETVRLESVVAHDIPNITETIEGEYNNKESYSDVVEGYLKLATRAFNNDRLTTPISDSAYLYYHKVLTLQPENNMALQGLQEIARRYVSFAKVSITQNHREKARYWLMKSDDIIPNQRQVISLMESLNETKFVPVESPPSMKDEMGEADRLKHVNTKSVGIQQVDDPSSLGPPSIVSDPSKNIVATFESRDRIFSEKTKEQIAEGNESQAVTDLSAFIVESEASYFSAPQSRRLLFTLYLSLGLRPEAEALVIPKLTQELNAYFHAKLHLFDGDLMAAIKVLETQLQAINTDEEYGAMTAGIYNKLQRFNDAEIVYKQLLENFSYKARYWLGLGLSLDQQEKYAKALKAYQRIAYSAGATEVMISFSNQRIQELNT